MTSGPPKVFISYSHDTVEHQERVLVLADRLRADGIDAEKGRLWVYVRDDRPCGDPTPPAAVFFYSPDRKGERPADHLAHFSGFLQADAYAGFDALYGERITEVACWSHARRKIFDVHESTKSPIAADALQKIGELYQIEKALPWNWASTLDVAVAA